MVSSDHLCYLHAQYASTCCRPYNNNRATQELHQARQILKELQRELEHNKGYLTEQTKCTDDLQQLVEKYRAEMKSKEAKDALQQKLEVNPSLNWLLN